MTVWNDRGVGVFLDNYLAGNSNGNETNWLDSMASYTFLLSGDPGSFGCGERDQPCFPHLDDCQPMFEEGRGMEYWVFNAVSRLEVNGGDTKLVSSLSQHLKPKLTFRLRHLDGEAAVHVHACPRESSRQRKSSSLG